MQLFSKKMLLMIALIVLIIPVKVGALHHTENELHQSELLQQLEASYKNSDAGKNNSSWRVSCIVALSAVVTGVSTVALYLNFSVSRQILPKILGGLTAVLAVVAWRCWPPKVAKDDLKGIILF